MENDRRFFVAIIGGFWKLDKAITSNAQQEGIALGRELAQAGFGLIVYFSNEMSLEPHVVKGFVEATPATVRAPLIRVRYPTILRDEVRFAEQSSRQELFDHLLFPGEDWEVLFYQSLSAEEGVDSVVLLAGATSTLIAGQIAIARHLPVLAIDAFGGSAAKVWAQLAHANRALSGDAWGTRPAADLVGRLHKDCRRADRVRAQQQQDRQRLATILERRNQGVYAFGATAALLAILVLGAGAVTNPGQFIALIFGGLAAGAVGAAVRIFAEPGSADPRLAVLLGAVAGLVAGLAYLAPQFIGAQNLLAPGTATVAATDQIQFLWSIIVALSAGAGFDTIFNRMRKQAESVDIAPP